MGGNPAKSGPERPTTGDSASSGALQADRRLRDVAEGALASRHGPRMSDAGAVPPRRLPEPVWRSERG